MGIHHNEKVHYVMMTICMQVIYIDRTPGLNVMLMVRASGVEFVEHVV